MRLALILAGAAASGCSSPPAVVEGETRRPNIVIVMTDDQGYGDLGATGNTVLRTPNIDWLAANGRLHEDFYVHPVCAPTRAALMTGRHPQRTGAIDTYIGRAMMDPEEVTLAEVLRDAGYATGLFGKWHLGDCYPMRPQDQGFEEVLMHRGGGIGQPSDPEGGEGKYTDPVLFHTPSSSTDHEAVRVEPEGYCTDIYFDAAFDFMRARSAAGEPFFTYIATNAPHGPFHDTPDELRASYEAMDLSPDVFPRKEWHAPLPAESNSRRMAQIFAMIENVDDNVGRLVDELRALGELDETLLLFLVDNGPNGRRYVAGLRGMKGSVYEGGVRSPLIAHWPGHVEPGRISGPTGMHLDLYPTILDACAVPAPEGVALDGESLLPELIGTPRSGGGERDIVVQAHRGDEPVAYHHCFLRRGRWKLVSHTGFHGERESVPEPPLELFDLESDPAEQRDLASEHPELVEELRGAYERWFADVTANRQRGYEPPPIQLGRPAPREVCLTRQDWRRSGSEGTSWGRDSQGAWSVNVNEPGPYEVRLRFPDRPQGVHLTEASLHLGGLSWSSGSADLSQAGSYTFPAIELPTGAARLATLLEASDGKRRAALQVILKRLD